MMLLLLKMKGKKRKGPDHHLPLCFYSCCLEEVPKSDSPSPNSVVLSKDVSLSISRGVGGSTPAFLVGIFAFSPAVWIVLSACSGLVFSQESWGRIALLSLVTLQNFALW